MSNDETRRPPPPGGPAEESPEEKGREEEAGGSLNNGQEQADGEQSPRPRPQGGPVRVLDPGMSDSILKSRIESLIFTSHEPLTAARARRLLGVDTKRTKKLIEELCADYENRGIMLVEVAGGWQFRSNPANAKIIRRFLAQKPVRLSRPALETLSIVAYRQPVTRPEIEDIRGVDSGGVLKLLLEKGFLKILGKKEEPGRPIIYGTSQSFLELFGLKSLKDLPPLREFIELSEEHKEYVDDAAPEQEPEPTVDDLLADYVGDEADGIRQETASEDNAEETAEETADDFDESDEVEDDDDELEDDEDIDEDVDEDVDEED